MSFAELSCDIMIIDKNNKGKRLLGLSNIARRTTMGNLISERKLIPSHIYIVKGTTREREFPEMYESPWDHDKTYTMTLFNVTTNKKIKKQVVYKQGLKHNGIWKNVSHHAIKNLEGYKNIEVTHIPVNAHCKIAAAETPEGIKYYLDPIDDPHNLPSGVRRL
jgi:hypothetical protein